MKNKTLYFSCVIGLVGFGFMGCASVPGNISSSKPANFPGRLTEMPKDTSVFDRLRDANDRQVQDFSRGTRVTYSKVHGHLGMMNSLSKDERDILILEGSLDFVRHYKNHRGQDVDEWLYETKDYQLQFKQGTLVYCDSVDQQAKMVLEYGQPTWIKTQRMAGGQQKELFWYESRWRIMAFSNGNLIGTQ